MSVSGLIVILLCAAMIAAGVVMFRLSEKQRPWGAIAVAMGLIGLLAYVTANQGSPPPGNATPTHGLEATHTPSATSAP